jgi:hypothetical protein
MRACVRARARVSSASLCAAVWLCELARMRSCVLIARIGLFALAYAQTRAHAVVKGLGVRAYACALVSLCAAVWLCQLACMPSVRCLHALLRVPCAQTHAHAASKRLHVLECARCSCSLSVSADLVSCLHAVVCLCLRVLKLMRRLFQSACMCACACDYAFVSLCSAL